MHNKVYGAGVAVFAGALLLIQFNPMAGTPAETPGELSYYTNCDQMREMGAAPIKRGDRGYETRLDYDHDGVACEHDNPFARQ